MQTLNVRRERQLEAKGGAPQVVGSIGGLDCIRGVSDCPHWMDCVAGGHALLAQGNNSAPDMRGQLVGFRFTPSFG